MYQSYEICDDCFSQYKNKEEYTIGFHNQKYCDICHRGLKDNPKNWHMVDHKECVFEKKCPDVEGKTCIYSVKHDCDMDSFCRSYLFDDCWEYANNQWEIFVKRLKEIS